MINNKNLEQGRSMIEMLGVLAIIGVLSVGGLAGYSKAMNRYKTNKAIEQITLVVSNMRRAFRNSKDYSSLGDGTGIGGKIIDKFNIVPDDMYASKDGNGTNTYQTPWGTPVRFNASEKNYKKTTRKDAFHISFDDIPIEACIALALVDWGGTTKSGGLIAMSIAARTKAVSVANKYVNACTGQSEVWGSIHCMVNKNQGPNDGAKGFPVSVASATSSCGKTARGSNGATASIEWKFY
ncbi:MAG: type II secretion system protein [Alphaproteobacteria bacterium]|nr:type II secretion system protein [Alphaproteobacteria bacterium]